LHTDRGHDRLISPTANHGKLLSLFFFVFGF
jgi:hypothetical protein